MLRKLKRFVKEKHQFRTHYCLECKQQKPCQLLSWERCCSCYYWQEREKSQEYLSLEKILTDKQKEQEKRIQQLKLLREYSGCPQCGSKSVDAYELYENNKLVCQSCLVKETGQSSSPISFCQQERWYQKCWGINLNEWLNNYGRSPINANCARKWLKNKQHLNNCVCLEQEAQEIYQLFTKSLREVEEKLKKCSCKTSQKTRIDSDYYAYCEKCEKSIVAASKKRVIKNRNDPKFWGLEMKERILCGECLNKLVAKMPASKKYTFNKYVKRYGF